MNTPSPELHLDRSSAIPGTWALIAGLAAAHVASAAMLVGSGRVGWPGALVLARSVRMRVTVGGQYRPLVDDGQLWRLMRSVLLHADLAHLLVNLVALWVLGRILEPWVGPVRLWCWFLLAGLGGSVASHLVGLLQSDGASGGAFGLFAAAVVLAWRARASLPDEDRPVLLRALPGLLVLNLAVGLALPVIDGIAHVGGLLVGVALAFAVRSPRPGRTWLAMEGAVAAVLVIWACWPR